VKHREDQPPLVLTAAIWGFAFAAQREGAQYVGAFSFHAARFSLGALSLLPVMAVLSSRTTTPFRTPEPPAHPRVGCRRRPGPLFRVHPPAGGDRDDDGRQGQLHHPPLHRARPGARLALGHRTNARTWTGVVLAVAGLWLLSFVPGFSLVAGDGLVLIGAFFWAIHILVIDRANLDVDPLQLSAVQFGTTAALSAIAAVATEARPFAGLGDAVVPVLYAGLISVGIAYTLQVVAQQWAKPAHAALILSLETVFGAVGGALVLGERMTARGYAGSLLILAGIMVSQLPRGNLRRGPSSRSRATTPARASRARSRSGPCAG
jgi:drug/metabolite transporter (DMT)-like permease